MVECQWEFVLIRIVGADVLLDGCFHGEAYTGIYNHVCLVRISNHDFEELIRNKPFCISRDELGLAFMKEPVALESPFQRQWFPAQ